MLAIDRRPPADPNGHDNYKKEKPRSILSLTPSSPIQVIAGRGEHGIASVAVASFEVIASHPVFGLHMPNDLLNRGTTTHLAADWRGDVLHLAADPDAELLGMVVAAIAFVDVDAAGLDPGQRFQRGDHWPQSMAVKRVAVQRFGVQHKLTAPRFREGRLLA